MLKLYATRTHKACQDRFSCTLKVLENLEKIRKTVHLTQITLNLVQKLLNNAKLVVLWYHQVLLVLLVF